MAWFETHWPRDRVLAMNVHLITHPELAVQHWFELQIAAMGETPHGMCEDASPMSRAMKPSTRTDLP